MHEDIYVVDSRNADRRTGQSGMVVRPGSGRVLTAQPTRSYGAPMYGQTQPQIIYAGTPQSALASNLFGRITGGQLVDLVTQIFAALMPLPAAPVGTSDATMDVGNLILYQGALAQYAKRDAQVRMLGNLVSKLLGERVMATPNQGRGQPAGDSAARHRSTSRRPMRPNRRTR